ncbi:MAG TPA: hypothetical protein VH853_18975 [Polyangia bacterium]|nr:hypothetical protein [Polyangia bacterium]
MNRSDSGIPSQLRVVGATDLERRLLEAGARELPSVELTRKMQQALGLSIGAAAVTAANATAAAAAKSSGLGAGAGATTPAFAWPAISVGVIALAVTGAVVGVRSTANHHAADKPPAAIVAQAPARAIAPPPAAGIAPSPVLAPATIAADVAPAAGLGRRMARASARHHAAIATTSSDLRAEIALVDAARTSVAGGADDRALALVNRYQTNYPRGTFRPEVTALRIEALDHLGRGAQARALAQKFVAAHPDSPLVERVARLTDPAIR